MRLIDSAQYAALGLPQVADSAGVSRRDFLKSSAAAGLVIGLQLPFANKAWAAEAADAAFAPNAFIRISPDNWVTMVIKHHEMGQGSSTGLATILAEELDADWSRVRVEYAPSDPSLYNNLLFGPMQGTGGSTAIANSWEQMRKAGAAARAMLVQAAAQTWKVPVASVKASDGVLSSGAHRASYGEMAQAAAQLTPPKTPKLKDPATFKLVGKQAPRLDSVAKCNGTAQYTIDVKLPGLLTAVIARPPAFGATLKSFDATAAKAVKGVTDVVQIPEGVAIVATGMWPALQGRKALKVEWDLSVAGPASTEAQFEEYRRLAATPGAPMHRSPDTAPQMAKAAQVVEAVYEFPYLAHAAMEPMNCVAWLHDGMLETWGAHQFPSFDHRFAAEAAGLTMDKVKLHSLISGGSFGRRANAWSDFTVEAVHVAKAIGGRAPVRVQWTREDDMRGGLYRPQYVHTVKVGLDDKGKLLAWQHAVVGQSIMAGGPMAGLIKDGIDETSVEGVWPTPYKIPAFSGELHSPAQPVKPLWWRSVGHTHTAYVMETMMDELAAAAGQDPVAYRLALLDPASRTAGVLKLAADKADWATPAPAGRARGIAVHESFNSYVAQVVEVSLGADGLPKVHRVVVAVDCGIAVNPDVIKAQMEGCVGFGLSAALHGRIDIQNGAAVQGNFHDYRVLRIGEMPQVEVHILKTNKAPTGVGEPGVPPLAPALANAVAKLSGQRVRRLPFDRHQFKSI